MFFIKHSQGWKVVVLFIVVCSIWAITEKKVFSQTSDQDLIETFEVTWKAQESEIATASIRYRSVISGYENVKKLTPSEVRKIVAKLAAHPDDFDSIVLEFHSPSCRKFLESLDHPWEIKEFKTEGNNTREDWHASTGNNVQAFDGEQEVITSPANSQIDLYAQGQSRRVRNKLKSFRMIPHFPHDKSQINIQDRKNGQVTFKISGGTNTQPFIQELNIDETTGMVNRSSLGNARGDIFKEGFQYGFTEYPGGVFFPTLVVNVKYSGGKLDYLKIQMIEEARFNESLASDTFAVKAPANTNVFDYRRNPNKPLFIKTNTDISNIVESINDSTSVSPKKGGSYTRWILIAVGVCLLTIGILGKYCRRTAAS